MADKKQAAKRQAERRLAEQRQAAKSRVANDQGRQELLPRRWWWVLEAIGLLVLAAGVAAAVIYSLAFLEEGQGGVALPFVDDAPTVTDVLLPPFAAFLVGGCLTFVGELLRRGAIVTAGNTNVAVFRPLSLVFHTLWLVILAVAWAVVIFGGMNAAVEQAARTDSLPYLDADSDAMFLIGMYAGVSALLAGAVGGSLFKKIWYAASVRRRGRVEHRSAFWWQFSYFWRADVWLVALGAALLGLTPLPILFESVGGVVGTAGVGGTLLVLGLVACAQFPRAGMPLGMGASMTGGFDSLPVGIARRMRG
jgi:hypothetical protein